jgi:hypothetical protein
MHTANVAASYSMTSSAASSAQKLGASTLDDVDSIADSAPGLLLVAQHRLLACIGSAAGVIYR